MQLLSEDYCWEYIKGEGKGCMGYNPKTTYCDLAELEKGGVATISAILCSNSLEQEKAKGESLVDYLKLGRVGNFQTVLPDSSKDYTNLLMDPFLSPPGSSKRARTPSSGAHMVSCLVDGCQADLSKCRDYHRRHKVCEMHSKTSRVTIGGHEQRFCQQCSRFHSLGEFDEGKRSCRKRLEGHNRRRRKPQPETLPVNPGNFFSASQGSRFLPFSSQPVIPATSAVNTYWSAPVKSESNPTLYSSSIPYSNTTYRGKQFPFLQVPELNSPLTGQTIHHDDSNNNNSQKRSSNGIKQVIGSNRALSLLSSSPAETSDIGLGRIIHPGSTILSGPTLSSLHLDRFTPYAGSHAPDFQGQPSGSELLASDMINSNSLCQDVFQNRSDVSSASGGYQTLSFSWE